MTECSAPGALTPELLHLLTDEDLRMARDALIKRYHRMPSLTNFLQLQELQQEILRRGT